MSQVACFEVSLIYASSIALILDQYLYYAKRCFAYLPEKYMQNGSLSPIPMKQVFDIQISSKERKLHALTNSLQTGDNIQ